MLNGAREQRPVADRLAGLDKLAAHRRLLLLQGPNGPFFARLADRLRSLGCEVIKVNFNGGDSFFYRHGRILFYRDSMSAWREALTALLAEERIDAIVLFGQWRRHHRIAIEAARDRELPFYVFEEGYVRPWWVTLEAGEVNAGSSLRHLDLSTLGEQPPPDRPETFRFAFLKMALWSFLYFAAGFMTGRRYPLYRHHRPFALGEAACWLRAFLRKPYYWLLERGERNRLLDHYGGDYFLVPLQVSNDSQLVHASQWVSNEAFISHVMESFAHHADPADMLVFKHHPMERGHSNYAGDIRGRSRDLGIVDRVIYLHDGRVPSLLKRSKGVIVVNSTVGLQALFHGVPLCVCGDAFYDKPGLTSGQSLDAFWRDPLGPDNRIFRKFYRYLLSTTQVNASFYAIGRMGLREAGRERSLEAVFDVLLMVLLLLVPRCI